MRMSDMIHRVVRALNLDPSNAEHRNMAKAAILSLREPTDPMIDAENHMRFNGYVGRDIWQAMIDAALVERV